MSISNALMKYCIEANDSPNLSEQSSIPKRDPEDYKWLRNALDSLEGDAKKIIEAIEKIITTETTDEVRLEKLEYIQYLVEDIDNANDAAKIPNALQSISNFSRYKINTAEENNDLVIKIRATSYWLLSTMAQNNPFCQKSIFNNGIFEKCINSLETEQNSIVISKLLGLISAMFRDFEPAQQIIFDNIEEIITKFSRIYSMQNNQTQMKVEVILSHILNIKDVASVRNLYDDILSKKESGNN